MLPNVVIAGAPKCGTTSLFAWLADHPDVCGSNVKEARYFLDPGDPLFDENSNYRDHGLAGYAAYFRRCEARKFKVVLEATPVYLYQATAPQALARIEPKPQIVFVFRKPSARVSSHFHFVRDSLVRIESDLTLADFVRLVETGDPRIPDHAHANNALAQSRYADYLPAWLARFPRSSVHFFLFEDLRHDQRAFTKTVAARLGLDPDFYDTYAFPRKNTTYRIRHPWIHLARRSVGRRLSTETRRRLKTATAGAYARINVEPARFSQAEDEVEVLRELDRAFAPYDERLAELTGLDLSAWH
jgi:sulfotransferase family protein